MMSVLPEMVGLRNTRLMLDQLHARGYPDEKVWMVLNRATLRGDQPRGQPRRGDGHLLDQVVVAIVLLVLAVIAYFSFMSTVVGL